jgi:hypothetical protein
MNVALRTNFGTDATGKTPKVLVSGIFLLLGQDNEKGIGKSVLKVYSNYPSDMSSPDIYPDINSPVKGGFYYDLARDSKFFKGSS